MVEMEQRLASRDLSVDVPIGNDDEATLLNFLPDNKQTPEEQFAETQYQRVVARKNGAIRHKTSRTKSW